MGKIKDWQIFFDDNADNFRRKFWKNISGDKKIEYAWDMVIEAMYLKGTPHLLKFQKKIHMPNILIKKSAL